MKRWMAGFVMVAACENAPIERLEAPPPAPSLVPSPAPPPPPPPPDLRVDPAPVPAQVSDFVAAHAADAEPWRVTFVSLGDDSGDKRAFLGGKVLRTKRLDDAIGAEVLAWLGGDKTYVTESSERGCGWVTPELGIEVARGSASLRMRYNCGYLFFDRDHKARATVGSDAIVRFLEIEARSRFER